MPFTAVEIKDGFWSPRLATNRAVTVRHDFDKCETTRRIANFAVGVHKSCGPSSSAVDARETAVADLAEDTTPFVG